MNEDQILHLSLKQGQVRVLMCSARETVQEAANIHNTTPVCAAALGRTLVGTAMLGDMLKGEKDSVTVTLAGNGPAGKITCVSGHGVVKGTMDNPKVELPLKENGKLDVSGAVGTKGRLTVIKDMGLRDPYVGQIDLVSGEIAEDFATYFVQSEQTPSLVALGVLTAGDTILSAGGVIIQPMPGCEEEIIDQLDMRAMLFSNISRDLAETPIEQLMEEWFRGMDMQVLSKTPLSYHCDCSRDRMERALISLGKDDLEEIIADDQGAELVCHFCHNQYRFTTEELKELLKQSRQ